MSIISKYTKKNSSSHLISSIIVYGSNIFASFFGLYLSNIEYGSAGLIEFTTNIAITSVVLTILNNIYLLKITNEFIIKKNYLILFIAILSLLSVGNIYNIYLTDKILILVLYSFSLGLNETLYRLLLLKNNKSLIYFITIINLVIKLSSLFLLKHFDVGSFFICNGVSGVIIYSGIIIYFKYYTISKRMVVKSKHNEYIFGICSAIRVNVTFLIHFFINNNSDNLDALSKALLLMKPIGHLFPLFAQIIYIRLNHEKKIINDKNLIIINSLIVFYSLVIIIFNKLIELALDFEFYKDIYILIFIISFQSLIGNYRNLIEFHFITKDNTAILNFPSFLALIASIISVILIGNLYNYSIAFIGVLISEVVYIMLIIYTKKSII